MFETQNPLKWALSEHSIYCYLSDRRMKAEMIDVSKFAFSRVNHIRSYFIFQYYVSTYMYEYHKTRLGLLLFQDEIK